MPRIVALGPYHHDLEHLKQMEEVKHVAAWHCTREGQLLEEMYQEFAPIAIDARCFYDKDVMAGISDDEFQHMMFFDACFLVQYMTTFCNTRRATVDGSLKRFMRPKRNDIFHDAMLLENQLPWTVVDTVLRLMDSSWISREFVARWRYCMMPHHHRKAPPPTPFVWYEDCTPPHLLGLLRYYIVGRRRDTDGNCVKPRAKKPKNMSFSVSAMDLDEIGITLKANKSLELSDIHLNKKGSVFTELCLAPLSLDRDSASYLINMTAIELCTVDSFGAATADDSAVCSYLLLLANLVCREEEVQELREKGLLQRGGGLTNAEVLAFFSCFQVLRMGPLYSGTMAEIEGYRDKSTMRTELHAFVYTHKKTIAAVVTGIGAVLGIIGTLLSIKKEL
uniref:Uncharacterized protein n=1 Tax=Saccharum hybrid cultivar R570 TaxID=131158 RepID=A0A059PZY9_9POAL|nr:hypothetical protein SHCRBa_160_F01_F_190 [Saccharum hybrid cultivar R570]